VPNIGTNSLVSTAKLSQAGYIIVFDGKEVNVCDAYDTKIIVTKEAIQRRWFDRKANVCVYHPYLSL
jgi:hypothetical protein